MILGYSLSSARAVCVVLCPHLQFTIPGKWWLVESLHSLWDVESILLREVDLQLQCRRRTELWFTLTFPTPSLIKKYKITCPCTCMYVCSVCWCMYMCRLCQDYVTIIISHKIIGCKYVNYTERTREHFIYTTYW